eukprot:GHVU01083960.1.p1 GENE.GHVU01083960.1~~GHVU01083960.1.p1  ORF type:complete len:208 (+),score=17.84 GHVU01083960.1:46-624(+)
MAEEWSIVHVSTGDLLREEIKQNTDIGDEVESYLEKGKLVPNEIVVELVSRRMIAPDCMEKGWLLDGFPRTGEQANLLKKVGIEINGFILLECPDSILIERVTLRRLDPITNRIYNLKTYPPATDEIRLRLIQRKDDTEETIRNRIREYRSMAPELAEKYRDLMLTLDGSNTADEILGELRKSFEFAAERVS